MPLGPVHRFAVVAVVTLGASLLAAACSDSPTAPGTTTSAPNTVPTGPTGGSNAAPNPVHVVLFTHIEDNTPVGTLGPAQSRAAYLDWRSDLIAMGELAQRTGVPWVLQPDWKFLETAGLYENSATTASTGGRNVLRHLKDSLGVIIDPHSHENGGYNYTDVAYLLDLLGVGGSTVIGGHIWDPSLPHSGTWARPGQLPPPAS